MNNRCPIYTVGDGKRTQFALRADGVWFQREVGLRGLWGAWVAQTKRPFTFGAYIDARAGQARLPNDN